MMRPVSGVSRPVIGVSGMFGTHTHARTSDALILPGGAAWWDDVGMCGTYDSVIGLQTAPGGRSFARKTRGVLPQVADVEATLSGFFLVPAVRSGLARA